MSNWKSFSRPRFEVSAAAASIPFLFDFGGRDRSNKTNETEAVKFTRGRHGKRP